MHHYYFALRRRSNRARSFGWELGEKVTANLA